jgi:hypothetical protein
MSNLLLLLAVSKNHTSINGTGFGVWGGGITGTTNQTATYQYTFAGNTVVPGTTLNPSSSALSVARARLAATSNGTIQFILTTCNYGSFHVF